MYINLTPVIKKLGPVISKPTRLEILKYMEYEDSSNFINNITKKAEQLRVTTIVKDLSKEFSLDTINPVIPIKPFPEFLEKIIKKEINPTKDIDNFSGKSLFNNCTAEAVLEILKYLSGSTDRHILIIGRHVGLEIFNMLLKNDYTVGIAHSKTNTLELLTRNADVIISATGVKNLITKDMVKVNSLVIDVGLGDVAQEVIEKAYVTPIRNGVGAVTTACLFRHLYECTDAI